MAEPPTNLAIALGRWLGADVTITGTASVGAQRATHFIRIEPGSGRGEPTRAVAQISESVLGSLPATDEAALLALAADAGVPVPRVLAATDDLAGTGAPALVVEHVEGLTVPRHILRSLHTPDHTPDHAPEPADARGDALARQCGEALARLHAVPADRAPASLLRLDHAAYVTHLTDRLEALPRPLPTVRAALAWLAATPVSAAPVTLVHADFRNGNLIVDQGRLAAVLDWELAQVTDPMQDLAWLCLRTWRFGDDTRPCGGFGSRAALRTGYESAGGVWRDDAVHWWSVARAAWWAIGLAGQAAAFTSGLTDAIMLAASGRRVPELEYDMLRLIHHPHH